MKRTFLSALLIVLGTSIMAGNDKNSEWNYTPSSELNLINKLMPTGNPLARLDSWKYPEMSDDVKDMCNCSTGHVFAFTTGSTMIGVRASFTKHGDGTISAANSMRGFDLYVEKDGQWLWAGSVAATREINTEEDYILAQGLSKEEKKCLLYLPHSSHPSSLELITEKGSTVGEMASPFKGRIPVFGSSFTHGAGCSRCGMLYTAQLARMTGYNFINMGFSGNCWLQPYFAEILASAEDIDACIVDGFSNPTPEAMQANLFPFIEKFQQVNPGIPLIFIKTLFREKRLVCEETERSEARKMAVADSLMRIAVRKYDDVYWVKSTNTVGKYLECTTDGTHPGDHGYTLAAESLKKDIVRILKKYKVQ